MFWKKALVCGMICLLLTGCGGKPQSDLQRARDLRTALLEAGGCSFTAAITADFGDRVYDFSVQCDYAPESGARITVLQPEEISGITAQVTGRDAVVEFEGLALDFGQMAGGNVTPMESAWMLAHCWDSAYVDSAGADGDLLRITYLEGYRDRELRVDTWLDASGVPVHGEILYNGVRCLTLEISQFCWNNS